jgi:hypothetical protein
MCLHVHVCFCIQNENDLENTGRSSRSGSHQAPRKLSKERLRPAHFAKEIKLKQNAPTVGGAISIMKKTNKAKSKRLVVTVTLTPEQNALLDALVASRERERQPMERPLTRAEVALLCLTVGAARLTSKETDMALLRRQVDKLAAKAD